MGVGGYVGEACPKGLGVRVDGWMGGAVIGVGARFPRPM